MASNAKDYAAWNTYADSLESLVLIGRPVWERVRLAFLAGRESLHREENISSEATTSLGGTMRGVSESTPVAKDQISS
jgi:hypothetical protein